LYSAAFTKQDEMDMQKQSVFRVLALTAVALTLLTACQPAAVAPAAVEPRPVKLAVVQSAQANKLRQFPALVEPTENARLTFRVAGRLVQLAVRPGQQVERNQLLAQLDPTDFKLKAEQADARYQLAKAQFDRAQKLLTDKLVSRAQYDEIKAQLQVSEADLKTAQTNLSYTEMRAPFSGSIARSLVENHENVAAQQAVLELQLRDMVDLVIQVPEDVIALVRKGVDYQPDVVFDAYPAQRYKAQIKEWDTRADAATNTFKVVFSMPSPKEFNVLSGMTGNVLADLSQLTQHVASGVLVPVSAVFSPATASPTEKAVWVYQPSAEQQNGAVTLRHIKTGELTSQGIVVLDGLTAGEQVVTAGVQHLNEGQQVRPWQRERGL